VWNWNKRRNVANCSEGGPRKTKNVFSQRKLTKSQKEKEKKKRRKSLKGPGHARWVGKKWGRKDSPSS